MEVGRSQEQSEQSEMWSVRTENPVEGRESLEGNPLFRYTDAVSYSRMAPIIAKLRVEDNRDAASGST